MQVIGLTGEKRGGKGQFIKFLSKALPRRKIIRMSFGDIVGEILDIIDVPRTRENMIGLPEMLFNWLGRSDVITQAMKKRIRGMTGKKNDILILDGIRTWSDLEMLRSFPGSLLVYVTASLETRYERAVISNEKVGDKSLTLEEFRKQESAEIEKLIPEIGLQSDYAISNERTLENYNEDVEMFVTMYLR